MAGILTRVFNGLATQLRSSLENPQVPLNYPAEWMLDIFNGGRTDSGVRVSEMTALQLGTVFACVNIISGAFASLPLHVFERVQISGRPAKKLAIDHSLWDLLHNEPNAEMTSFTWLKTAMIHDLLWGNAYCEITRSKVDNSITGIWPRNPARTRPVRLVQPCRIEGDIHPVGTMLYETSEPLVGDHPSPSEQLDTHIGVRRYVLAEDMLHVPGLSLDGRLGQSVVYLARQVIGLALATEKYGAKFFGNGARPAGILTLPSKIEDKAIENLRRSWAEAHGGENQFKVAVLEQGVKFEKIAATPEEGQMLATRNYQRTDICAIFNVPLHMVAATDKSGKSNVEQSSIEFVMYCLNPWVTAWQKELERKLFPKMGRNASRFFPKFDTRHLMYPDADSRAKFYSSGKQWGYLNSNEIRELEDMNPVTDGTGEEYAIQINMQNAKALIDGGTADGVKPEPPPAPVAAGTPAQGAGKGKPPVKKAAAKGKRGLQAEALLGKSVHDNDEPIYAMRHGETDANDKDIYRGQGPYKLNDEGRGQVADAATALKGKGIKRIVTSSLPRHQESAQIASAVLGNIPIETDDDFKALHVGVYQGKERSVYGEEVQWYLDHPEEVIPGGESVLGFWKRTTRGFARVRALNKLAGPTLTIVSRSSIHALLGAVDGQDIAVAQPGGVYKLDGDNSIALIHGKAVEGTLS